MTQPPETWARMHQTLTQWVGRMSGVYIERLDAAEVIDYWDQPDALFYVDPPYVEGSRANGLSGYAHEMTDDQHRELAEVLHRAKGMVVLSGYHSPLYDELFSGWTRYETQALADRAAKRTEVLWLNPAAQKALDGERGAEQLQFGK